MDMILIYPLGSKCLFFSVQNEQIRQSLQHIKNGIRSAGGYLRATNAIIAYYQQAIQTDI